MSKPFRCAPILAALILSAVAAAPALGADRSKQPAKAAAKPTPAFTVADASPDQVKAAELVYYGTYDCEFNQSVNVVHGTWLMKPVLSSTGAIRLEDVHGETLMVQIASKSMLLNVKAGKRLVDECLSPKQHEIVDAEKA